jgi:hypothetical protein
LVAFLIFIFSPDPHPKVSLNSTALSSDCPLGSRYGALDSTSAGKFFRLVHSLIITDIFLRWGYPNISETELQVKNMRAANIPLEGKAFVYIERLFSHPLTLFLVAMQ